MLSAIKAYLHLNSVDQDEKFVSYLETHGKSYIT